MPWITLPYSSLRTVSSLPADMPARRSIPAALLAHGLTDNTSPGRVDTGLSQAEPQRFLAHKNCPPQQDHHWALDMNLLSSAKVGRFLMSEVPL